MGFRRYRSDANGRRHGGASFNRKTWQLIEQGERL
jgi:hypothetical protein